MALNIKNEAVERLVAEVARLAGESKTEAVRRALEERKARLAYRLADGALGSRGAWLLAPYADAPDTSGNRYLEQDAVTEHLVACTRAGVQAGFHAIGDAALDPPDAVVAREVGLERFRIDAVPGLDLAGQGGQLVPPPGDEDEIRPGGRELPQKPPSLLHVCKKLHDNPS